MKSACFLWLFGLLVGYLIGLLLIAWLLGCWFSLGTLLINGPCVDCIDRSVGVSDAARELLVFSGECRGMVLFRVTI